ncbi:uncharacterized protein ARMOST_00362 [Armillaria ostoyae]|uniref:Uncharacterized protein n=1 Tax=Armillaria ostoyae TaxID=47428 RepID=A0A284QKX7_ARMOS|nr:uncharacterized protein ARMOST_00362 [Armillaria ostoyae]
MESDSAINRKPLRRELRRATELGSSKETPRSLRELRVFNNRCSDRMVSLYVPNPVFQAPSTSSAFSSLQSHPPYPHPVQTTNHQHRLLNHVFDNDLRLNTLKDGPKYHKMSKVTLCSQSRFKIVAWTTELASSYAASSLRRIVVIRYGQRVVPGRNEELKGLPDRTSEPLSLSCPRANNYLSALVPTAQLREEQPLAVFGLHTDVRIRCPVTTCFTRQEVPADTSCCYRRNEECAPYRACLSRY